MIIRIKMQGHPPRVGQLCDALDAQAGRVVRRRATVATHLYPDASARNLAAGFLVDNVAVCGAYCVFTDFTITNCDAFTKRG